MNYPKLIILKMKCKMDNMIIRSSVLPFFLIVLLAISCNYVQNRIKNLRESNISGVVIDKYREKWNHGSPVIKLNNGAVVGIIGWTKDSYLWEQIEIGDSVSKPTSTTDLILYKKNGDYFLYKFNE